MISSLKYVALNFRFADFLDIIIVTIFLYYVFMWLRRKASRSVVIGVIAVFTLYTLARILNMYMTNQVFQSGLTAVLVGLVIIFQEDIRKAVERISTVGTFHSKHNMIASNKTIDCVVESLCNLARDRIGALVVIRGRESLERHLVGGIPVNGRISTPLLYSIFHPETPNHDGAVIIEGERIEKFGVRLPLSHNLAEVGEAGTRHTAALGLAERSDVLVIVVSEERGIVSIAEDSRLFAVDKDELRSRINAFYARVFPSPSDQVKVSRFTQNASIKVMALFSAVTFWLTFAHRTDTVSRNFTIPIEYRNAPANWVIEDPKPTEIRVLLNGPERSFNFGMQNMVASFELSHVKEGFQALPITESNLNTPSGLIVSQISPKAFTFKASKIQEFEIPVKIKTTGKLLNSLELVEIKSQPQSIRILIPASHRRQYSEISTEPVNLEKIQESGNFKVRLLPPAGVQFSDANQEFVKVVLTISKKH